MKKTKKKKECSFCEMRKKMKNSKGEQVKESYARTGDIDSYLQELRFAAAKPFKLNFREGFSVSWKNAESLDEAKMTKAQMKKKEEIAKSAKKEGGFKKYGERADEVRSRTAIKMAKKKNKK